MKRITDHIRDRLIDTTSIGDKTESYGSLLKSEWSSTFERLMRNRLIIGRYRYGRLDRDGDQNYDRVGNAIERLRMYQKTKNAEYLVDAANLCMVEFVNGDHHFEAVDDGPHVPRN